MLGKIKQVLRFFFSLVIIKDCVKGKGVTVKLRLSCICQTE